MKRDKINQYIKEHFKKQSDEQIGNVVGLTANAVRHRRRGLGLKSPFHTVPKSLKLGPISGITSKKIRTLLLDVETAPSIGAFFDLWKEGNIVWTEEAWFMLSFAWKWLGESKVQCRTLSDYAGYKKDPHNDKKLIEDLWKLIESADVIVGHNGDRFDLRKTNARIVYHGFSVPAPYKTVDTLKVARRYFKFDSNRLNDLGLYLGVGNKIPHTGSKLWKDCMKGDAKSWEIMRDYNKQDVNLLERVYLKLRPWMNNHPNVNLVDMKIGACPTCGSTKLNKRGYSMTRSTRSQRFQCVSCGTWSTGKNEGRLVVR